MIYNIYQYRNTNLWGYINPEGYLIWHETRRQCIQACTSNALKHKTSCTIISKIIWP